MKPRPLCPASSAGRRDNRGLSRPHPSALLGMALLTMTLLLPLGMHPDPAQADGPTNTLTGSATVADRFEFGPTLQGRPRVCHLIFDLCPVSNKAATET